MSIIFRNDPQVQLFEQTLRFRTRCEREGRRFKFRGREGKEFHAARCEEPAEARRLSAPAV